MSRPPKNNINNVSIEAAAASHQPPTDKFLPFSVLPFCYCPFLFANSLHFHFLNRLSCVCNVDAGRVLYIRGVQYHLIWLPMPWPNAYVHHRPSSKMHMNTKEMWTLFYKAPKAEGFGRISDGFCLYGLICFFCSMKRNFYFSDSQTTQGNVCVRIFIYLTYWCQSPTHQTSMSQKAKILRMILEILMMKLRFTKINKVSRIGVCRLLLRWFEDDSSDFFFHIKSATCWLLKLQIFFHSKNYLLVFVITFISFHGSFYFLQL